MIGSSPREARTGPSTLKRSAVEATGSADLGDFGEESVRRCSGTRGTPSGTPSMQSP
ncbi:hypothetical protein GCM10010313_39810 [Streptomyces violarus]|nr:hypothetical protein GCM10010313_39810 [Streptomyces violarus]